MFRHLGVEQGLSHDSVTAVLQDRRGFFWLGTHDGLNRWDGVEVLTLRHDPDRSDSLSGSTISSLLEDLDGTIWIGSNGGLDHLDPVRNHLQRIPLAGLEGAAANDLALAPDGTLWVATSRGLLAADRQRRRFRSVLPAGRAGGLDHRFVQAVEVHGDDLWVLTSSESQRNVATLHRIAGGRVVERHAIGSGWELPVTLHVDRQGRPWLDGRCPARIDENGTLQPGCPGPVGELTWDFHEDDDGTLWTATSMGLYRNDGVHTRRVDVDPARESALSGYSLTVARDRWGGLLVGTLGGFFRSDPMRKPFHFYRHLSEDSSSLPASPVSAVVQASDGRLWLGTYGGGLALFDPRSGVVDRRRHARGDVGSLCDDVIWALAPTHRRLWIGTEAGLCSLDFASGRFSAWPLAVLRTDLLRRVNFVAPAGEDLLWLGTTQGLVRYDVTKRHGALFRLGDEHGGAEQPDVVVVRPLSDGRLAVGTQAEPLIVDPATGEVHRLVPGREMPHDNTVYDLLEDDDALWLATGEGLLRFGPHGERTRIGVAQGLPGDVVASLTRDRDGRLWVGTNRGLARVAVSPAGFEVRRFDPGDGLGNVELNRHAACASGDLVAFGGMSGLTLFAPREIHRDTTPPNLALTRIEISGQDGVRRLPLDAHPRVVLSARDHALTVGFVALSFVNPRRNRYAYRLEKLDPDWIDTGGRRFVTLAGLAPGAYRLLLRGSNEDGVWSRPGLAVAVRVEPPFWQTTEFRLAVLALVLLASAALYLWRLRHRRALETLRMRIASDLHDDVASELSGIALASDTLRRNAATTAELAPHLEEIGRTARTLAETTRDIVWYVFPGHDRADDLAERMRATARRLLPEVELRVDLDEAAAAQGLDMETRRVLFLTFKEAVHNIARHAAATHVEIRLSRRGSRLELEVRDDGVGFDPQSVVAGHGLRSLTYRARQAGGDCHVESARNGGTAVRLVLPLTRARDGAGASPEAS